MNHKSFLYLNVPNEDMLVGHKKLINTNLDRHANGSMDEHGCIGWATHVMIYI